MNDKDIKLSITKNLLIGQVFLESIEEIKEIKGLYKQGVKNRTISLIKALEEAQEQHYSKAYDSAEDFIRTTENNLDHSFDLLTDLNIDEISNIGFMIQALRENRERTQTFLSEVLNVEMK